MEPPLVRKMAALIETGMTLASELDLNTLLQRIADLSRDVIGARYAAVGVVGDDGMLTRFVHSGIEDEVADEIGHLPEGRGVLGVLIEEGRPLRLRDISDHPKSYGFPENHPPMHSFLGVPIIVRGRAFGRLYITEKLGLAEFSKDDERIALTLASQAGVAIENARLLDEIARSRDELAVLEERERISRELHDGVIQSIYSVGLSLQAALALADRDVGKARERVDSAIAELDNVVRDVRGYIFELRPKALAGQGLRAAIHELARSHEVNTLADVKVELEDDACEALLPYTAGHAVQVIREVLSNVARHAKATEVSIKCWRHGPSILIEIADNGIGFDPDAVKKGHGLRNMRDRARQIGGALEILPRDGGGTRHLLLVPGEDGIG